MLVMTQCDAITAIRPRCATEAVKKTKDYIERAWEIDIHCILYKPKTILNTRLY